MSADNFVVVRQFPDGFRWASFSFSGYSDADIETLPDEEFYSGPFISEETCLQELEKMEESGFYIEYGIDVCEKPSKDVFPVDKVCIPKKFHDDFWEKYKSHGYKSSYTAPNGVVYTIPKIGRTIVYIEGMKKFQLDNSNRQ